MLTTEILHPSALDAADAAVWRDLCASHPDTASPLLGPDFARAVGASRPDAAVAIWRQGAAPVAFLPHMRRPGGLARPIGAPLSDYHGLVAARPMDLASALSLADISAYRFSGLVGPAVEAATHGLAGQPAYVIDIGDDAPAYLEALRSASPKRFKNFRRLEHKLEREVGPPRLVAPDQDPRALEQVLAWKRDQLARSGLQDFLAPAWVNQLLWRLFSEPAGELRGLLIGLYAGDQLLAGQFGVRHGGIFHPWIASTNPNMHPWSPGQLFLLAAIAAMPGLGLRTYDLGPGHEHYKAPFALSRREIWSGTVAAAGVRGLRARMGEGAWRLAEAGGGRLVQRARRRFETISTVELTLSGRVRGLASAVASRARRSEA
ncbi:GNAT family N-acetyltransferase [Phenylobacterium sp.]|uniref:GNAT family N-acetyltransferase n=1 Tax=Phenylobacterium sp. TaxID=1871053 RepID=UPI002FD87FBB